MNSAEFAEILERGYERPGVEFKAARPRTDKLFFAKVVRAILGMANRRDGGLVILGVEQAGSTLNPVGLLPEDLGTWTYDDLASGVSAYADPYVEFELELATYRSGTFVLIHVHEFEDTPVLCKRDYQKQDSVQVLRSGACYVRTKGKPETSEVPTHAEMRDLLELATQKRLRAFLATAMAAGLAIPASPQPTDAERFEAELGDLK